MKNVIAEIHTERARQITHEGFNTYHDTQWKNDELIKAAFCYILYSIADFKSYLASLSDLFPWDIKWWKPKDKRRNLIKAAALIVAEIERMDEAESRSQKLMESGE